MRAGRLRHLVEIQQDTGTTVDGSNAHVADWTTLDKVRAEVRPTGGGESYRGMQVQAEATTLVIMYFRDDVRPQMRIIHNGRTLNIVRADELCGRKRELWVQCKEQL